VVEAEPVFRVAFFLEFNKPLVVRAERRSSQRRSVFTMPGEVQIGERKGYGFDIHLAQE
jgi:hypothetical protein